MIFPEIGCRRMVVRMRMGLCGLLVGLLGAAAASARPGPGATAPRQAGVKPTAATAAASQGQFRKAVGTRTWEFPRDHGQHPDYRLEWWYYTGNVRSESGRRFGFQVTFFRLSLRSPPTARRSAWAARSIYLAHAALSDVANQRFFSAGRSARESLGLAGAAAERHRVWLAPWRAEPIAGDPHGVTLRARTDDFSLDLTLQSSRPPVLHGRNGLDQKGQDPGQASWYYSLPRMPVSGTVALDGQRYEVSGLAWMDHEFGTNQLSTHQIGWDWFAIHLSDGVDLMLYRFRAREGGRDSPASGTLMLPGNSSTPIRLGAVQGEPVGLSPRAWWDSPASGGRYPVSWDIDLPGRGIRLAVRAAFDNQELIPGRGVPFPYWEGAISVSGTHNGNPVDGDGYMELTGYAGNLNPFFK